MGTYYHICDSYEAALAQHATQAVRHWGLVHLAEVASEEARGRGCEAWAVYTPDETLLASGTSSEESAR